MSLTTVGTNGRVYRRAFDHDEARRRFAAGESASSLAREYGVSPNAVLRVIPQTRTAEGMRRYAEALKSAGRCDDCGGPMNAHSRYTHGSTRCRRCASLARATSVRDGELRCMTCRRWLPDEDFPFNAGGRGVRRGRHGSCRACNTKLRQEYRERRKVPCAGCGAPALPPSEKGPRAHHESRCRQCFYDWQREHRRGGGRRDER